jgi:hypothetical protein
MASQASALHVFGLALRRGHDARMAPPKLNIDVFRIRKQCGLRNGAGLDRSVSRFDEPVEQRCNRVGELGAGNFAGSLAPSLPAPQVHDDRPERRDRYELDEGATGAEARPSLGGGPPKNRPSRD